MHWTEAFTSKLSERVGLVGTGVSCEGAPEGGNAAGSWRNNPYVLPYAWATHRKGWELLQSDPEVFKCHADAWDVRYHSDSGASLAVLRAGMNLDCLLTRYQGVNWADKKAWRCNERWDEWEDGNARDVLACSRSRLASGARNARHCRACARPPHRPPSRSVRPDAEMTYDGVSITPYETVFVPYTHGAALNNWTMVQQAARYQGYLEQQARARWLQAATDGKTWRCVRWSCISRYTLPPQATGAPDITSNALVDDAWEVKGQRLIYMNARGPGCFDFKYYVARNPGGAQDRARLTGSAAHVQCPTPPVPDPAGPTASHLLSSPRRPPP